ncbi:MAG TPA: hypothetical protein VG347_11005 [Verrucomicrobiae bacterium]|nr:hypothetical protein [Verrucomicrobiae bacterium]
MVRPPGDILGPNYTTTPFPRLDAGNPDNDCNHLPPGNCGGWLAGGDLNGVSAQEINDTVDDIMACGATKIDHNCYQQNGTVDMTASKLFGGQWVLARKYWHGVFAFDSNDACAQLATVGPDQTKYTVLNVVFNFSYVANNFSPGEIDEWYGAASGGQVIDAHSGIITNGIITAEDRFFTNGSIARTQTLHIDEGAGFQIYSAGQPSAKRTFNGGQGTSFDSVACGDYHCSSMPLAVGYSGPGGPANIDVVVDNWNFSSQFIIDNPDIFPTTNAQLLPTITDFNNYSGTAQLIDTSDGAFVTDQIDIVWSRNGANFSWGIKLQHFDRMSDGFTETYAINGSQGLHSPYTAAQCYEDFKTALGAWNMSDLNLARFRTDESLALAPLCVFDEVGPTNSFGFKPATMNDYSGGMVTDWNGNAPGSVATDSGQHDTWGRAPSDPYYTGGADYIVTWNQTPWIDPNNYIRKSASGGLDPSTIPGTGGCHLVTPTRTGEIISHTPAGSDRHFWFGYSKLTRVVDPDTGAVDWVGGSNGGFSADELPPVSMRWMNNEQALYDGFAGTNPAPGNYPQAFLTQLGGELRGAKFVQATQKWPSVNFGRPCGPDKYAVYQTTVCCIASGDASSGFTVKATGNAIAPAASGGLAVNDYIFVDGAGIYKISGIATTSPDGDGNAQWIITVGAKIDDLPTGAALSTGTACLGRLRWPSASGICGRAAITTTFATPTVTIISATALPYLRIDPASGTLAVDIYDASMTLLVSSLALTRVSDTSFTATHAALGTAAWMTGAGVNWTKYDSSSKKTGVHLEWSFNARAAAAGSSGPWYAGVAGCTGGGATQFSYSSGACPAVVGISPYYSAPADTGGDAPIGDGSTPDGTPVENFANQVIFDFPAAFTFDALYGGHWQAAVMLAMPDPFWQAPFMPSCDGEIIWREDDGSGEADDDSGETPVQYYAHHPLVEALVTIPAGDSLPGGVTLFYANPIAPPYYPNGIPIADADGNYPAVTTDWGFTARACADIGGSGRFSGDYVQFVSC